MAFDPRDSPLYFIIEHENVAQLRELLASAAPLVYHFEDGWSPLHHAVDTNSDSHNQAGSPLHLDLIQPFLDAGVAVNALWYRGDTRSPETPLDVAEDYGNEIAADAIRQAGGRSGRGVPGRMVYPSLAPGDKRSTPRLLAKLTRGA